MRIMMKSSLSQICDLDPRLDPRLDPHRCNLKLVHTSSSIIVEVRVKRNFKLRSFITLITCCPLDQVWHCASSADS